MPSASSIDRKVHIGEGIHNVWIVWSHGEGGDPPDFYAAYDGKDGEWQAEALAGSLMRHNFGRRVMVSAVTVWPMIRIDD